VYQKFFNLNRAPFELSPDPFFLLPTARHKEALASIYYGISQHKGFVVLSGEVGTGKTLMVRCLLEMLKRQRTLFANVFNPLLSPKDFLGYVAYELGVRPTEAGKGNLLRELYLYLLAQHRSGATVVLVVDEAQQLPAQVLEEIRLLTNLETSQQKLLQILLVGQPELDQKLENPQLRQLKQRVSVRCHLGAFTEQETRDYIVHRIRLCGGDPLTIFPDATLAEIYRYSRGTPRLINTICDQTLVAAFARQISAVPTSLVDEIARNFRLHATDSVSAAVDSGESEDQRAVAGALLKLVESLERAVGRPTLDPRLGDITTKPI
jgi:general secretion pathway protein A